MAKSGTDNKTLKFKDIKKELDLKSSNELVIKEYDPIEEMVNKEVFFIEPLSLALTTGRRDPKTGLPGIPLGTNVEMFSAPGKCKSSHAEHFVKNVLKAGPVPTSDEDFAYSAIFLNFEKGDPKRFNNWIKSNGLEPWHNNGKIVVIDSSTIYGLSLAKGLNKVLAAAKSPELKVVVVDSFGAAPVGSDFENNYPAGIDENQKMNMEKAKQVLEWMIQWSSLDSNTRPVLFCINHYTDPFKIFNPQGYSEKAEKIGEDLNMKTSGGAKKTYFFDIRIKLDAKKWVIDDEKHPLFDYKEQIGFELVYEVFRNKVNGKFKGAKGFYNMEDIDNCHFDLEEEIIDYCNYLNIRGVDNPAKGRWVMQDFGDKSCSKKELCAKLRARPELKWEIIKEIAPRYEELFRFSPVERTKEPSDSSKAVL